MARYFDDCGKIARHAQLMHAQDRAGTLGQSCFDTSRINIERFRLYVDEDRCRATVTNSVRGGNVRVADCNYFVAWPDTDSKQSQMQRCGAVRYCARVRRANHSGKLTFECRDFRALGDPAA